MALKMVAKAVPEVVPMDPEVMVPPVLVQPESDVEALTAEFIELWKRYEYFEVKALVARMDAVRKSLALMANESVDDTKPAIFTCAQGEVEFTERGKVSEVPNPLALIEALLVKFGPEVTTSVVTIGITALRKVLSDFELKPYLVENPGSRRLRAVRPL